jgi:hypothetical protein
VRPLVAWLPGGEARTEVETQRHREGGPLVTFSDEATRGAQIPVRTTKVRRPVSTSIVPNTVRFAFHPLIGTFAGFPRSNQPALSGGKRCRSVSSSNSLAQSAGKLRTSLRMRRSLLRTRGDFAPRRSSPGLFQT